MNRRFGARLESTVVYYRQEQHLSYQRTLETLQNLHGMQISQGGIDQIMQRAGREAAKQVGRIQADIQQSAVVYCDETGSRVEGQNWWQWVFSAAHAVLHIIRFNRSADVIQDVMDGHPAEVWVSDCLPAQLKAPAQMRQLCLAHQLRNLQALLDRYPKYAWPLEMQELFRSAIHLHHQRDQLAPPLFQAQVRKLERRGNQLLKRSLRRPAARKLLRRYQKHRNSLFVFLHRTDVEPTNNRSERNLRPSVIHRKVIGCFRSGWGARTYAALASVIDTAALKSTPPFVAIQALFGPPALPLPAGGRVDTFAFTEKLFVFFRGEKCLLSALLTSEITSTAAVPGGIVSRDSNPRIGPSLQRGPKSTANTDGKLSLQVSHAQSV